MTIPYRATARSYSNIALIKYWGNRDDTLCLPTNGSISMNLAGLETVSTVQFDPHFETDRLILNGTPQTGVPLSRVRQQLDHIRRLAATELKAVVVSQNNFPAGTGIASSASAFSALTVAACRALKLDMGKRELSLLARLGSGSACRSIPEGFVEWHAGSDHDSSYAESIAPSDHWDLVDLVAVVSHEHKSIGSTGGHTLAPTSPLQAARVADAPRRLDLCRVAILSRDFDALAEIVEQDALLMHAVMLTAVPALIYWHPSTLRVIEWVRKQRAQGIAICFTIDAGPNVHVITTSKHSEELGQALQALEGVQSVLTASPGQSAHLIDTHLSMP